MHQVKLKCNCGKVEGVAKGINPKQGTRVVCYCNSCQDFARHLQPKGEGILDSFGGTDIYQVAPCQVEFTKGQENIAGIRLSAKGVHRWHTTCCNTPIGNTVSVKMPFVGLIHNIFDSDENAESYLGPVRARVHSNGANKALPPAASKLKSELGYMFKFMIKMLGWKLSGKGVHGPFYEANGKRIYSLTTLNSD